VEIHASLHTITAKIISVAAEAVREWRFAMGISSTYCAADHRFPSSGVEGRTGPSTGAGKGGATDGRGRS
jgi:hypothetical protein